MVRALRETVHKATVRRIKIAALALKVIVPRVTVHHSRIVVRARRETARKATVLRTKIVALVLKVIVRRATVRRSRIVARARKAIAPIRTVVHVLKGIVHKAARARRSVNVLKVCLRTIDNGIIDIKRQTKQTHGLNAVSFFIHD